SSGSLNAAGKVKNHGVLIQTIATLPANTPTSFLNIGATKPYYGVDMSPAAVMNNVTVSIAGNKECTTFSGESVRRCFDIQAPDGILTTVTFHYLPNELNGLNPETMLAYHWTAPGWEDAGVFQSRVASGSNLSVTMSGVNNFSPFVLAPGTPTAVNLESFAEASTNAANTVWNSVILFAFLLVILIGMTMIIIRKRNLQH
ncbi:MAG: hypothetical protein IAF02_22165, partial [Anaerolineae bacterium]|nr:hypothetical protein [Anaerolineae bacterium]